MNSLKAMVIAISMYSKIPVPRIEWEEKNMKHTMCFFPLIGVIIGVLEIVWWKAAAFLEIGNLFYAVVGTVLPFLVTGGIHMDGFMDTMDALKSYQSMERRLEIMKDPHLGAFAVIGSLTYCLLYLGAVSELKSMTACVLAAFTYVLSRTLSGLSFALFTPAKKEGLFYQFAHSINKNVTIVSLGIILGFCCILVILIHPLAGILVCITAGIVFLYYAVISKKYFGGITGDLAGFFLQICELATLIVLAVTL